MIWFLIFLYAVMGVITASFAFAELIHKNKDRYRSGLEGDDYFMYVLGSLLMGAFWFITIWMGFILWYVSDSTPFWAEMLIDIVDFITLKVKK